MVKPPTDLRRYAMLSVAAAIFTIGFKTAAWALTGSVGLLSDALESVVNLFGAVFALWMLGVSRAPPDREHPFGHGKAEYFSAGFEGVLILGAAVAIGATAVERLISPQPLEGLSVGLACSVIATAVNFVVARLLIKVGTARHSIALEGDGRHLMTDVWTSVGVVVGLALVTVTHWQWLDPVIALLVAANIIREAISLMRRAADGLMDRALPDDELVLVAQVLQTFSPRGVETADLRTHRSGHQRFVTLEVFVPDEWTVKAGHDVVDELERALAAALQGLTVITHLAPRSAMLPATTLTTAEMTETEAAAAASAAAAAIHESGPAAPGAT